MVFSYWWDQSKSTVVSGNRSYANTNKYGRKVIVFGDSRLDVLTENYLVISYQN